MLQRADLHEATRHPNDAGCLLESSRHHTSGVPKEWVWVGCSKELKSVSQVLLRKHCCDHWAGGDKDSGEHEFRGACAGQLAEVWNRDVQSQSQVLLQLGRDNLQTGEPRQRPQTAAAKEGKERTDSVPLYFDERDQS